MLTSSILLLLLSYVADKYEQNLGENGDDERFYDQI